MAINGNRPRFHRFDAGIVARADDNEPEAGTDVARMVADAVSDLRGFCDSMRADFGALSSRMDSFESRPAARADDATDEADVSGVAIETPVDGTVVTEPVSALSEPEVPAEVEVERIAAVENAAEQTNNLPVVDVDYDGIADAAAERRAAPLRADIARLQRMLPGELSIEQRQAFAGAQEQAEAAFQSFGDHAPAPMMGEGLSTYKRRMASKLQSHSDKWKGTKLTSITDDATLDVIIGDIYNDAAAVARRGADVPQGMLSPITRRTPAGHTIVEYRGNPGAWMRPLAGATRRATGKFNTGRN